jgi:integrase
MAEARGGLPVSVETWLSRLVGKTQNAYRRAWEDLFQFTGREPEEITPDDISRWLYDLSTRQLRGVKRGKRNWARRGYAESTAAQWAAAISSFYTAMEASSQGWRNPVMAVMRPRAPGYRSTSFLTVDEVRAWLRAIQRDTIHGRRNLAIGLTLITTGRRSAEVCRMRWGDLPRDGERVWWLRPGSAAGEAERLPLSVWRAITDYLAADGRLGDIQDEDFVFTAVTANASRLPTVGERDADENRPLSEREVARMIKRYARIAGLDPRMVSPTTLRYTAAKLRREAGDSVSGISALLGISTASTHALLRRAAEDGQGAWVRVEAMLGL